MKKLIVVLLFVAGVVNQASAQKKDSLSFDERDKYIYYRVTEKPGLSADTLYKRALYFLNTAFDSKQLKAHKKDKNKGLLTAKGGFMVMKKSLVTKHFDARISYNMTIEVRDGKYRYWLTDFEVTPYERNRYAIFVPVKSKKVQLEHGLRALGSETLDDYLASTLENCRIIADKLAVYMSRPSGEEKESHIKKSVTTKEW